MPRTEDPYGDLHEDALELLQAGCSAHELSQTLGVPERTLKQWHRRAQHEPSGVPSDEAAGAAAARVSREPEGLRVSGERRSYPRFGTRPLEIEEGAGGSDAVIRGRHPPWAPNSPVGVELRRQAGIEHGDQISIALVDWPAMDACCGLLEGQTYGRDPFTALAGFSTIVGALIFYDRVLVLNYGAIPADEPIADRAGRLFGADSVIRGIKPPSEHSRVPARQLDDLLWACLADLDDATRTNPPWFSALQQRWSRLLPKVDWPDHSFQVYAEAFGDALMLQSWYPMTEVFALGRVGWRTDDLQENLPYVVLANDARALYYSRLAAGLRYAFSPDQSIDVRYVGGPLRTPMLASLSDLAQASLEAGDPSRIEDWLNDEWRALHPGERFAVRLPLWLEAVLSRSAKRSDIPDVILEFRHLARAFRQRRRNLERQLAERNRPAISKLVVAMAADAAKLTGETEKRAGAALEAVDVGVRAVTGLPAGPKLALSTLSAAAGQERMGALRIRLFHPELRCMYELGRNADKLANSLPRAFATFGLEKADSAEPMNFLTELGEISALV